MTTRSPGASSTSARTASPPGFAHLGVGRGDRIGLLMLNRPEFLETCVAAMKLGAMAVPMNVRFTPTEIAFLVADAGCAIVVTDATLAPSLDAALAERPDLPVVLAEDFDSARRPTELPFPVTGGDDDPLYLCYTSGTTGNPKARGAHPPELGLRVAGPGRCRARCPAPTACCSPSRWRSPAGSRWR